MLRTNLAILVLLFATLSGIHKAAAYSVEKGNDMMGGDSSNFTDPDEKKPAFLISPGQNSSSQIRQEPSVTVDQNAMRERYLGLSQGFDQAYSRK